MKRWKDYISFSRSGVRIALKEMIEICDFPLTFFADEEIFEDLLLVRLRGEATTDYRKELVGREACVLSWISLKDNFMRLCKCGVFSYYDPP